MTPRQPVADSVRGVATEGTLPHPANATPSSPSGQLDEESRRWLHDLAATGHAHDDAVRRLHELLLPAARFEVSRRRNTLAYLRGGDHDDLAQQSADDALVAVLRKLGTFRGDSRFTTWAYKFALYEAAVKLRRRAWQERELRLEPDARPAFASRALSPGEHLAESELLGALRVAIAGHLSAHPARGARRGHAERNPDRRPRRPAEHDARRLYKTLHDARRKLRTHLPRTASTSPTANGSTTDDRPRHRRASTNSSPHCWGPRETELTGEERFSNSTATSMWRPRATSPIWPSLGCARRLIGCPACREDHDSLPSVRSSVRTAVLRRRPEARVRRTR